MAFASFLKRLRRSDRSSSPQSDREIGAAGESAAEELLTNAGYRVLDKNWSCSIGEVDIICQRDGTCVFVEVKTSRKMSAWPPETRVNREKQTKLRTLATLYLKYRHLDQPCRFDVIAVWWESGKIRVNHSENAF